MHLLTARNGHSLLPIALDRLLKLGVRRPSRNGDVIKLDGPALICYERPLERVMFWPERDANPFFHFMEALGYLAGRKDLPFYTQYLPRMADFSDDGHNLTASYGYRWRQHFGRDQLTLIIERLRSDRDDRRQVLSMWDGSQDLNDQGTKRDVPCNTHAYFTVNEAGRLDLTICNRSNDLVWGLLGANMVHFSFLLEYVAIHAGLKPGRMFTLTNNLHGYIKTVVPLERLTARQGEACYYELNLTQVYKLGYTTHEMKAFDRDLMNLDGHFRYETQFFKEVVRPLQTAHRMYKEDRLDGAAACARTIAAPDWQMACVEWLERRAARRKAKAGGDEVTHEKQS